MKSLAIIGSTGSIGESALKVYKKNSNKFNLLYLAANSNIKKLLNQNKIYKPKNIFLLNNQNSNFSKNYIKKENIFNTKGKKIDYLISGISGYDALDINIKFLKISKNILLANKETIICGGKLFLNLAKKYKCNILPIDSEHFCLDFVFNNLNLSKKDIDKVYLIASGGPFYNSKINYKEKKSKVINHPNWKMGDKISVDSSNFANKVLELFEAKFLFDLKSNPEILVEQNSNTHAMIKFKNNLYIPVLHKPTMQIAISSSLQLSNNFDLNFNNLPLSITKPNLTKFPLIKLGYKILNDYGHKGAIIFTVINERLVNKYLNSDIYYGDITKFIINMFNRKNVINVSKKKIKSLHDIKKTILFAKNLKI